ncbi:hypothetical protein COO60DRAFT_1646877 [Scenedesmus sp. NREL 46B-D3]|nr:hypothetical protein COO60DRAFT_1646877 [Scenedesmus sp. NREL 46B-D3]
MFQGWRIDVCRELDLPWDVEAPSPIIENDDVIVTLVRLRTIEPDHVTESVLALLRNGAALDAVAGFTSTLADVMRHRDRFLPTPEQLRSDLAGARALLAPGPLLSKWRSAEDAQWDGTPMPWLEALARRLFWRVSAVARRLEERLDARYEADRAKGAEDVGRAWQALLVARGVQDSIDLRRLVSDLAEQPLAALAEVEGFVTRLLEQRFAFDIMSMFSAALEFGNNDMGWLADAIGRARDTPIGNTTHELSLVATEFSSIRETRRRFDALFNKALSMTSKYFGHRLRAQELLQDDLPGFVDSLAYSRV